MEKALARDQYKIRNGQAALNRVNMVKQVDSELRKMSIQQEFLSLNGCECLANWIDLNPNKTFPNMNVVEEVLAILFRLTINTEHLQNSKLAQVVGYYAEGLAHYKDAQKLAQ